MDFIYLFRVLLKRKWIILGTALIAATLAYFLTKNEPKYYRSTAQVSTGFTISNEISVTDERFSFFEADTKFNNVIVTTKSPAVLSLLSYSLILHDLKDPRPFRTLTNEQKNSNVYKQVNKQEAIAAFENKLENMSMLNSFRPEEKKLIEYLRLYSYDYKWLAKNLTVGRLQRTDYLQIDYISENPELSAFVVNTVFQQFLRYYRNVRDSKSQESIDTLRSLVEKKKQELDSKNAILRGEGMIDVKMESTSKLETIASLENSMTQAKEKQTELYYAIQKINQRLGALGAGGNKTTSTENEELLALRKVMNDAYIAYVNGGSTDKALLNRYNDLKTQYQNKRAALSGGISGSGKESSVERQELLDKKADLQIDAQAVATNITSIQSRINALKGNVQSDASKGAAMETLLKEAELANNEYLAVKQKYNDAMDRSGSSVNNFRQVLAGQPAIDPEPSKRMMIIGMAGVAAMVTTILIIVLLTYLDPSVKTPMVFSRTVNLKLISMINFINLKNKNLVDVVGQATKSDNAVDHRRLNIFRESLRKLRYEIESSGKKIFLFASTKKGQGKTTLIQALSYSMSLSKKKILIIDTNFCNNDLTVQLHAQPILETTDMSSASNSGSIIDKVKAIATDVGVGTVFAIGSEGGDYTPSEILPTESLLQHLNTLTSHFDYIFLEGPPLNDFSDSKELVQYVDGVIAVFSATHIIKQIDKESIKFFKELNGKFTGSILNMVDLENVNVT